MDTEYRRGIPSVAHIEVATRLGLEWEDQDQDRWRFEYRNEKVWSDVAARPTFSDWSPELHSGSLPELDYRPISTDGTPVDWEVLDAEAARAAQPATVTPTASAAPMTQPQGFRADLWRRICEIFSGLGQPSAAGRTDWGLSHIASFSPDLVVIHGVRYQQFRQRASADILTRWAVYQELKPLYDLVDGAQGEAAMPRDVEAEWYRAAQRPWTRPVDNWLLARDSTGLFIKNRYNMATWRPDEAGHGTPLRDFAAVLDAVAERRVAERMRGQTQATTVTSAQPEPRRFSDVRPDRHGWRWWRQTGRDSTDLGQRFETQDGRCRWRSAYAEAWFAPDTANPQMLRYTVIPTDEQGNPVNWEAAGFAAEAVRLAQENVQRLVTEAIQAGNTGNFSIWPSPPRPDQFSNNPATPPLTRRGFRRAVDLFLDTLNREAESQALLTGAKPAQTEAFTTLPPPLPRFTADELDDVDHSKTTKLDEVTLRRGKLPTVEQIAKYREVRARRSDGTVADALRESRIDCEVAQYVLERWAGGLSDKEALWTIIAAEGVGTLASSIDRATIDERVQQARKTTLDIAEPTDNSAQRQREEREAQRLRMAALQAQLAAERAARTVEPQSEPNRFDLLECDPKADPAVSIAAWEARQKRSTVRLMPKPQPQPQPLPAPCRLFEVVDAEAEGLRPGAVFTALLGRALNPNC